MAINGIDAITGGGNAPTRKVIDQNYQDFLKLLTTQLQHQDPTDPTDTNQLTQQIATLSQVEQQLATNDKLSQLISLYGSTQYNSMASYLGKKIEAPGNNGALKDGEATFAYYVADDPQTLTVKIKDNLGDVVYSAIGTKNEEGEFVWKDLSGNEHDHPPTSVPVSGRNEFVWHGKNNSGQDMPEDVYTVEFAAKDASNNDLALQTYITGIVRSVDSAAGQVYLSISDILSLPLQAITSIREPNA